LSSITGAIERVRPLVVSGVSCGRVMILAPPPCGVEIGCVLSESLEVECVVETVLEASDAFLCRVNSSVVC
jgi:hypothetical protein